MAPLRFRAWHTDQKRFFSPEEMGADELTLAVDGRGLVNVSGSSTRLSQYAGDTMRVMQSTGVEDKHGREIFEGDIVDWDGCPYICEWFRAGLGMRASQRYKGLAGSRTWGDYNQYIAVIGNIYENPDILPGV